MIFTLARLRGLLAALPLVFVAMNNDLSAAPVTVTQSAFANLTNWANDDHEAALSAFQSSCRHIRGTPLVPVSDWAGLCQRASAAKGSAKEFFEGNFQPVRFDDGAPALLTAYYEPEIPGALRPDATYRYPLYRVPPDLPKGRPWKTRAEIEAGALAGRNLELVWLRDPVDAFFLHVQGSGRIHLPDGTSIRVGFAGRNGHPYRSVGREMARRGYLPATRVSARRIGNFVRNNPDIGRDLLNYNNSYIFFRKIDEAIGDAGPVGAMGVSVTPMRSLAVDPAINPLGAPIWIERKGVAARLMIAQDVGSAIKGAQRGDLFIGSGREAGEVAGHIRQSGRLTVLIPRKAAMRLFGAE